MEIERWWLGHQCEMDGHKVEFRGWINTIAERKEDFPEMIKGSFWAQKNSGERGMHGYFHLDDGSEGKYNFVCGAVYPIYLKEGICGVLNREDAEKIVHANEPLEGYPRFDARIEDCINLDLTYIQEIN